MSDVNVSVIIPFYNAAPTLERAINSAFAQRFRGTFEIILVDDHSTDGSRGFAKGLLEKQPEKVKRFRHQVNRGLAAAKNTGMHSARGLRIMFLDADDEIAPNLIATLYAALQQNPGVSYVWPTYHILTEHGDTIRQQSERNGSGVLFRRAELFEVGFFNEDLTIGEEADMYKRMDAAGLKGIHVPAATYYYYQTPNSLTRSNGRPK